MLRVNNTAKSVLGMVLPGIGTKPVNTFLNIKNDDSYQQPIGYNMPQIGRYPEKYIIDGYLK